MKVDRIQLVALLAMPVMLGAAGLSTFFWMWGTSWADMTGVSVGIIYVVLTVIQVLFTVTWWRIVKSKPEEETGPEPLELKSLNSADRIANNDKKLTESPLLHHRGGGGEGGVEA